MRLKNMDQIDLCQEGRFQKVDFLVKNLAEFVHILLIPVIIMYFVCQKASNLRQ